MRVFDSPATLYSFHVFSVLVLLVVALLLVCVWKASPATIGSFKSFMLKMAISDFVFTALLEIFYIPDIALPLPAAEVRGLARFFGHTGIITLHIITVVAGAASLIAVLDCCIYRALLFFNKQGLLEHFSGQAGICVCIGWLLVVAIGLTFFCQDTLTADQLVAYAKRHKLESCLEGFNLDVPFIGFDADKLIILVAGSLTALFICGLELLNVILTLAVMKKINESKSSMSRETLQMQRSLNIILLAQVAVPGLAVILPVGVHLLGAIWLEAKWIQSVWFSSCTAMTVGSYPLINSAFCIYLMKPYRAYCRKLVSKVIPCVQEYATPSVFPSIDNPSSRVAG